MFIIRYSDFALLYCFIFQYILTSGDISAVQIQFSVFQLQVVLVVCCTHLACPSSDYKAYICNFATQEKVDGCLECNVLVSQLAR